MSDEGRSVRATERTEPADAPERDVAAIAVGLEVAPTVGQLTCPANSRRLAAKIEAGTHGGLFNRVR